MPASVCIAGGSLQTSLWLDEILYFYLQSDFALRAAEIGRSGSWFAPYFSSFFFCDVQRLGEALLGAAGLTWSTSPEIVLRAVPLVSFVGACYVFYSSIRRRSGSRFDAVLGTLAFSSMPLILHYVFEARVYIFTVLLVVVLMELLERTDAEPSPAKVAGLVVLGLLTVHSHPWTVCLFLALAGDAAVRFVRERCFSPTVVGRVAAALPAIALTGTEWLLMKWTDPGRPQYLPFRPQPLFLTVREILLSNFAGPMITQYLVLSVRTGFLLCVAGAFLLIAVTLNAMREGGGERRPAIGVAVSGLGVCVLLAVSVGYYQHARYHLPLIAALLFAVVVPRGPVHRALLAGLVVTNLALLPDAIEQISRKSDGKGLATSLLRRFPDRSGFAVLVQHVPTGGYPFPSHSIVLDFYLNVLHPGAPEVRILELPHLERVNGRRGVYDFFACDPELFVKYFESRPDLWRRRLAEIPKDLVLIHPVWGTVESRAQLDAFARALLENGQRELGAVLPFNGFPHSVLIELTRKESTPMKEPPGDSRTSADALGGRLDRP